MTFSIEFRKLERHLLDEGNVEGNGEARTASQHAASRHSLLEL